MSIIAKKPYIFMIFSGGPDPLPPPPSGSVPRYSVSVLYVVRGGLQQPNHVSPCKTSKDGHVNDKFNFWNVHGILNTGLRLLCKRPEVFIFP